MGYVMRDSVTSVTREKMLDTMAKYNASQEISFVWDELQRDVMHNQVYSHESFWVHIWEEHECYAPVINL